MRTKAKAESAALHAGLRKEQMKVESLERALQQKVTLLPCLLPVSRAGFALDLHFPALSILLVLEVSVRFLAQKLLFCGSGFWGIFLFACFVSVLWFGLMYDCVLLQGRRCKLCPGVGMAACSDVAAGSGLACVWLSWSVGRACSHVPASRHVG